MQLGVMLGVIFYHFSHIEYNAPSICPDKIFFVQDKIRFIQDKIILSRTKHSLGEQMARAIVLDKTCFVWTDGMGIMPRPSARTKYFLSRTIFKLSRTKILSRVKKSIFCFEKSFKIKFLVERTLKIYFQLEIFIMHGF